MSSCHPQLAPDAAQSVVSRAPSWHQRRLSQPGFREAAAESVVVEAILLGMIEEAAPDRVPDELLEDFLGIEPASWLEHASDLTQRIAPLGDMVDDAEVEDRIVGSVVCRRLHWRAVAARLLLLRLGAMKPWVLIAVAAPSAAKRLRDALAARCEVTVAGDRQRAMALLAAGSFDVVVAEEPLPDCERVAVVLAPGDKAIEPEAFAREIDRAVAERRRRERETVAVSSDLGRLSYREFVALARERVIREYLLALMRLHRGSVTRAADQADIERESLHRLLKRHRIRADDFRKA